MFQLPHGSVVTYQFDAATWVPEWILVDHELDLLPYRALIRAVAQGAQSAPALVAAAKAAGGQMVERSSPRDHALTASLPPPLTPPAHSPFSSLTAYLRHTPEAIRVALAYPLLATSLTEVNDVMPRAQSHG